MCRVVKLHTKGLRNPKKRVVVLFRLGKVIGVEVVRIEMVLVDKQAAVRVSILVSNPCMPAVEV